MANARGLEKAESLNRYMFVNPGTTCSRILVNDPERRLGFYWLDYGKEAFDTIACQKIGSNVVELEEQFEEVPYAGARFTLEARFSDGSPTRHIHKLEVNL